MSPSLFISSALLHLRVYKGFASKVQTDLCNGIDEGRHQRLSQCNCFQVHHLSFSYRSYII